MDDPQLNFPSCSRVESKLINTDTLVKFPYYKCVRMVGREQTRSQSLLICSSEATKDWGEMMSRSRGRLGRAKEK